ncbi:MAG: DUF1272 domain-containing protein [Planctomycetes bacterium]|nr:DUF1272 domain-containing protein [Planctomycetota bacterium]
MLELRPNCEHCGKSLPPEAVDARICSFECTFCADCVERVLENVCPNCGGGFERRPVRPRASLAEHPASAVSVVRALDPARFEPLKRAQRGIPPAAR